MSEAIMKTCVLYQQCRKIKASSGMKENQEGKNIQDDEQRPCY